jgi:hypothetical protein
MSLPRVIEYLTSINTGQGNLVLQNVNQIIATIPPLTRINIQTEPSDVDFAEIVYRIAFDTQMVPSAFYVEGTYSGNRVYGNMVNQYNLDNPIDAFAITTHGQRSSIVIDNRTNLNQYFACTTFVLTVTSSKHWDQIIDALRRLETPLKVEELLSKMQMAVKDV